jgi:phosphoribosylanthranilate isomerase
LALESADAVAAVAPHGLDLCSSVRSEGRLDAALLRSFFSALAAPPRAS